MNLRLPIAADDISSSPILARRFKGKTAKEVYRCSKNIILSRSVVKLVGFAIATIPAEMTKGVIYIAAG